MAGKLEKTGRAAGGIVQRRLHSGSAAGDVIAALARLQRHCAERAGDGERETDTIGNKSNIGTISEKKGVQTAKWK